MACIWVEQGKTETNVKEMDASGETRGDGDKMQETDARCKMQETDGKKTR